MTASWVGPAPIDPGDPEAVEVLLSAPPVFQHDIRFNVMGRDIPLTVGQTCPLCFAIIPNQYVGQHFDWHRNLAAAISNAANMSSTLNSLIKPGGDA